MSEIQKVDRVSSLIMGLAPDFKKLAAVHGAVNFDREASFAMQLMASNSFLAKVAMGNLSSLRTAVLNVAAVGISLSPVHKQAYLVPRDGKICLDISCRGYVQLAVDVGSIKWAKAEIVHQNDVFEFRGMGERPEHRFSPFGKRGDIIGAYCVAKTHDGEYIVEMMPIEDIYSIRDRSQAWKAYQKDKSKLNPWVTDSGEMIKKTVIKRAYKSWPMTDTTKRMDIAVDASNEVEGLDFREAVPIAETSEDASIRLDEVRALLKDVGRSEEALVGHLVTMFKRHIESVEDLTESEVAQTVALLKSFLPNGGHNASA